MTKYNRILVALSVVYCFFAFVMLAPYINVWPSLFPAEDANDLWIEFPFIVIYMYAAISLIFFRKYLAPGNVFISLAGMALIDLMRFTATPLMIFILAWYMTDITNEELFRLLRILVNEPVTLYLILRSGFSLCAFFFAFHYKKQMKLHLQHEE